MTTTETPGARVDDALTRFRELQAQFERVRDRLKRAEDQKNSVNRRTYDKVRAEYDRELDALRAKMTPLRQELESHRSTVESGLSDANASLDSLEEELAEVVFRHRVGEYSDEELAKKSRALEARLDGARARISEQKRTLDLFDTMAQDAKPTTPNDVSADSAAPEGPNAAEERPALRTSPRVPSPAAPDDPVSAPRPVLRAKGVDATPPAGVAADRNAKRDTREEAPAPAFENPHDWIKEMGRESDAPKRPMPTATPARPRLGATPPSPAPAAARKTPTRGVNRTPSLVFVNGAHAGESVPLLPTTLSIGREHDNNVELKDPDVARYHARILYERGNYVVEDLDSTTGTWVNGQRTKRAPLNHGDVVRVGSTEIAIDFEWASDPV